MWCAGVRVREAFGTSLVCTGRCSQRSCKGVCQPHLTGEETEACPGEITHGDRRSRGWAGFQLRVPEPQCMALPRPSCLCVSAGFSGARCVPLGLPGVG